MDAWDASRLARKLMDEHGLASWRFGFNRRKRGLGLCRFEERRIELSIHFVMSNPESEIRDTILHEVAHALVGHAAGHGPIWKRKCLEIGARPERCDRKATMPLGRWHARCPNCGYDYHRHRRPATGQRYVCTQCGPERGTVVFRPRGSPGVPILDKVAP